jgi:hypothetical protein
MPSMVVIMVQYTKARRAVVSQYYLQNVNKKIQSRKLLSDDSFYPGFRIRIDLMRIRIQHFF